MIALEQAEQEIASLNPAPFYIPLGSWKPILHGVFEASSKRNWVYCGHRARLGGVLRGCKVERLLNPQNGARPFKIAPSSLHPAHRALHAVGSAIHTQTPTICFLGTAAVAQGSFYEALNLAALHKAPVLFLLVHHPLNGDAPLSQQAPVQPHLLAKAFGISSFLIQATQEAVQEAVTQSLKSFKTTFIEITLEN